MVPTTSVGRPNGDGKQQESEGVVAADRKAARGKTAASAPKAGARRGRKAAGPGIVVERRWTTTGVDPFDQVEWDYRTAAITGEKGETVFEQRDVEVPRFWSQLATNVVVSKYFRGHLGDPAREHSVKQLIGRVVRTISGWGRDQGYFAGDEDADAFRDELCHILLHQKAAFNSPVWFNVGLPDNPRPQASACQPYNAPVNTPYGCIPIGQVVENRLSGLEVCDAHGTTRVVAVKHNGRKPVLRIHTKSGHTLDVTPDHLVWRMRGGQNGRFVEAGTLRPGDRLAWHRNIDDPDKIADPRMIAEAALAGWLQTDGFVGQYEYGTNRSLTIEALTMNDEEFEWVLSSIRTVFPDVHYHIRDVATQDEHLKGRRIRLYGEVLRPFIEAWGLLARGPAMSAPERLTGAPLAVVAAYLRSAFQAEGYVNVRGSAGGQGIGLAMIAPRLVHDLQRLLARLGIFARVSHVSDPRPGRNDSWVLTIGNEGDRRLFAERVGFVDTRKQQKLAAVCKPGAVPGNEARERKTLHIARIEALGEMDVYDIQTESGEYLSGNLRVHNCFINSVEDTMESIMLLAATEARLFKGGSGAGTNLSRIRSSREPLQGGGIASGPVSFMRGYDAFAGVIKCLTPDAYVYTDGGLRRLGEIIDERLTAGFHADESVVLATKDEPTRISHVYVSPEADTFRLRLRHTGLSLRGTGDHPVLTLTPEFRLVWKKLVDLVPGDRVAVSRGTEMWPAEPPRFDDFEPVTRAAKKTLSYSNEMTPELARLLGYMVSEGCLDDGRFRFSNADEDVFNDFLACVQAVFGVEPAANVYSRTHPTTGTRTWQFEACWTNAVRFLRHVGLTGDPSASKQVPWSIRCSPRSLVVEFLRAYFEGDGHVSTHVYAASASEGLLQEVQLLLLNMGMLPQLRPHPVNGKTYWCLYLRGDQAFKFVREVGFVSARKRSAAEFAGDKNTNIDVVPYLVDVLRSFASRNKYFRCADGAVRPLGFGFFNRKPGSGISYSRLRCTPSLIENLRMIDPQRAETLEVILEREFFWDAVASVESDERAVTYDFTVPGTHSFVANGIVNHNSGGKTRRAAKMQLLDVDHPDVVEFIKCKADEERKAWTLIEAGYDGGFNVPGGAYDSVFFQNANLSVRVSDEFMHAVESNGEWRTRYVLSRAIADTYKAGDLLRMIADGTHVCGDPGVQFDTTINRWHTCKATDRIYASNPCCVTGDTLIGVADGRNAVAIRDLVGETVPVYAWDHAVGKTVIGTMHNISVKRQDAPVYRVTLDDGSSFRATDDHLIMLRDGSYRQVKDLKPGDSVNPFHSHVRQPAKTRNQRRYVHTGRGWRAQYRWIWETAHGIQPDGWHIHHRDFDSLNDRLENLDLIRAEEHEALHRDHMLGDNNPARRLMNDTWRANIARAVGGEKNPHYGKPHTPEALTQMRAAAAERWSDPEQREQAAQRAHQWMEIARQEGRRIGRTPGERYERCCPACRQNFTTPREEQIFCSETCRYSPIGLAMIGAKGGSTRRGRPVSPEHREKLRLTSTAAARPEDKRRGAEESLRSRCLKAARLLLDAGHPVSLDGWDGLRGCARDLGAAHVPHINSMRRFFGSDADLCEQASLYNHKVVSVEFDGVEDVFDGTVDGHHNFAILTSQTPSDLGPEAVNYSGCFIHNSEFVFLDDTACNLSSLNLMRFRREDGEFDVAEFVHGCEIMITAQEILVDNASYPTEKIGVNSHEYRPLGLGYANLGALLMARGLPYDSDAGRAMSGAITAVMTGAAYRQSARIAEYKGPFPGYAPNREAMLEVMALHRSHVEKIDHGLVPGDLMGAAHAVWDETLELGRKHGYKNAQATVLAPTGTISFLMDCDTTGIEPDIALVKYKTLVGGGVMKIVNQTVPEALRRLGYSQKQISTIVDYIDANGTIEGAPGLRDEDLPVFDCAFRAASGTRSIHYMGHVRMMAAAQPFISGAISKTVNVPEEATVEEIEKTYVEAWKQGLKAVAIYRDNSKRTQPLSTKRGGEVAKAVEGRPFRRKLPDERASITHKFSIGGHEGYVTVGMYEDGTPGEIFITMSKEGSTISGLMDSFATAISLALQYGVPLPILVSKFSHARFEPAGWTNNKAIPVAKSVMDYIFRWLALKFLPAESPPVAEATMANGHVKEADALIPSDRMLLQQDAPPCSDCGSIMIRAGACYRCLNCGSTSGCG